MRERGDLRKFKNISKKRIPISWRSLILTLFNLLLLGGICFYGYRLLISDEYVINDIRISGVEFVAPQEVLENIHAAIDEHKYLGFKTKNIYLTSESYILESLNKEYLFEEVHIEKLLPHTIDIRIIERNITYTLVSPSFEYLIDDNGILVKKVSNFRTRPTLLSLIPPSETPSIDQVSSLDPTSQFPVLIITQDIPLSIGETVLQGQHLDFINKIFELHTQQPYELFAVRMDEATPQSIHIKSKAGYEVLLSTSIPYEQQAKNLAIVLQKEIKDKVGLLEYIDMRLGSNVYYKFK